MYFWKRQNFTIIGSGITGLTSAYFLKQKFPKADITILERGILPSGASTKNAGFACFGSLSEILDDMDQVGDNRTLELIKQRVDGLHDLRKLFGDKEIGFENSGGYELFMCSEREFYQTCMERLVSINDMLEHIVGARCFEPSQNMSQFGFQGVEHLLFNRFEGMINTGLMMKNLIRKVLKSGVEIRTNIAVQTWQEDESKVIVQTDQGDLATDQLIIATNGLTKRIIPNLDVSPARAQVLVTTPIDGLKVKGTFHHHKGFDYFRNINGRILLGGGRHIAFGEEETTEMVTTQKIQSYLEELLRNVILPNQKFEIEQRWSGIMGVGKSKDVILKSISARVTTAVRLGGMGVALGTRIGQEVADRF